MTARGWGDHRPAAASYAEHEQGHRDREVEHPGDGLEPGGLGREVEDALEDRAVPAALVDRARDVEGQVVQPGQHPGLLEVVDAVAEDAGRDHDQEAAGPGEELREVDPDRPAVEQVAEHDGRREAQRRAGERLPRRHRGHGVRTGRGLGRGPQEERGLEALTADGQRRDEGQRPATGLRGPVDLAAQLAAETAGGARHPEDHPGHERRPR